MLVTRDILDLDLARLALSLRLAQARRIGQLFGNNACFREGLFDCCLHNRRDV